MEKNTLFSACVLYTPPKYYFIVHESSSGFFPQHLAKSIAIINDYCPGHLDLGVSNNLILWQRSYDLLNTLQACFYMVNRVYTVYSGAGDCIIYVITR